MQTLPDERMLNHYDIFVEESARNERAEYRAHRWRQPLPAQRIIAKSTPIFAPTNC
jgi:hypothetical protein